MLAAVATAVAGAFAAAVTSYSGLALGRRKRHEVHFFMGTVIHRGDRANLLLTLRCEAALRCHVLGRGTRPGKARVFVFKKRFS